VLITEEKVMIEFDSPYQTRPEIEKLFKVSTATIYRWMNEGKFPKPIHLGANMVRWKASDIEAWMIAREASL
jgi:prophage regulatory protein|tara:strand:+ start:1414 stop:1629 length:216 start_codon:yes stop_codon:yes gene_type:complete